MDKVKNIPYFFLFVLSLYPILKEAITSITLACFIVSTCIIYRHNLLVRYRKYGIQPILINSGFYVVLFLSAFYSDDIFLSIKKLQSSLLLFVFPMVLFYFFPKVEERTILYFSFGFILSVLILIGYFFIVMVNALEIDRFSGLSGASFFDQISAIIQYPYEFVISKVEKHLSVIYETHKVYLSLQFLIALVFCLNAVVKKNLHWVAKVIFVALSILFSLVIFYTQAITTVLSMVLVLFAFPFFFLKRIQKMFYVGMGIVLLCAVFYSGIIEKYKNTNTETALQLVKNLLLSGPVDGDVDPRLYVYDCTLRLIKTKPLVGYGIGDVQDQLNKCYNENEYVVARYRSKGQEINSHNYYLHLWLSGGVLAVLLLLFLFYKNMKTAFKAKVYIYFLFLLIFMVGLLTENLLVRILGVLPFAVLNAMFYSNIKIVDGKEEHK